MTLTMRAIVPTGTAAPPSGHRSRPCAGRGSRSALSCATISSSRRIDFGRPTARGMMTPGNRTEFLSGRMPSSTGVARFSPPWHRDHPWIHSCEDLSHLNQLHKHRRHTCQPGRTPAGPHCGSPAGHRTAGREPDQGGAHPRSCPGPPGPRVGAGRRGIPPGAPARDRPVSVPALLPAPSGRRPASLPAAPGSRPWSLGVSWTCGPSTAGVHVRRSIGA